MNLALKNFLMIVLKNAVNAVITDATLMTLNHGAFNLQTTAGLWNLAKAAGSVILAREVTVWGPIILNWTRTNADPAVLLPIETKPRV